MGFCGSNPILKSQEKLLQGEATWALRNRLATLGGDGTEEIEWRREV